MISHCGLIFTANPNTNPFDNEIGGPTIYVSIPSLLFLHGRTRLGYRTSLSLDT
jgi:hypothetical protein